MSKKGIVILERWTIMYASSLKVHTFVTLIKQVLLCHSETLTSFARLQKCLDGTCTTCNLLRKVQNISWRDNATQWRSHASVPVGETQTY